MRYQDRYTINKGDVYFKQYNDVVFVYSVIHATPKTAKFHLLNTTVDFSGNVSFINGDCNEKSTTITKRFSSITNPNKVKLGDSVATKYEGQQLKIEVKPEIKVKPERKKVVKTPNEGTGSFDDELRADRHNSARSWINTYVKYYDEKDESQRFGLEMAAQAELLEACKQFVEKFDK